MNRMCRKRASLCAAVSAVLSGMAGSAVDAAVPMTPISLDPGSFNYNTVVTSGTPGSSATIAGGTPAALDTENGVAFFGASYSSTGALPAAGTPFTSSGSTTQFEFNSYTTNNTLLINADQKYSASSSPPSYAPAYAQTGSLTLASTAQTGYSSLAVLYTAAGQNYYGNIPVIDYTLNFADGTSYASSFQGFGWGGIYGPGSADPTSTVALSLGRAWLSSSNSPGKVQSPFYLYETDLTVPTADDNKALTGISFYDSGSGYYGSPGSNSGDDPNSLAVYALSGYKTPQTITYTGAVSGSWNFTSNNFAANGAATVYSDGKNVIFDDTATGPRNITIAAAVTPSSVTFNNNTSNYSVAGQGIAGTGTLTLNGTGSVTLSNSNTYTGATLINAGSLILASGGSIASTAVNISTGALLVLHGSNSLASTAVVTDNGNFNLSGATATLNTLNGTGNLYIDPTSTLSLGGGALSGTLTLASGGTLVSTGSLLLGGSNVYNGSVNISSGTLQLSATGSTVGTHDSFAVNSTATLDLLVGGPGQLQASDVSTILAKTSLPSGSSLAFDTTGGNFTMSSSLPTGGYGLTKYGVNTLTLAGSGLYSGTTNVSAGTLQLGATNALSPNSIHNIGASGTLDLNAYSAKIAGLTGSGVVTNSNSAGTSTLTVQQPSGTSVFSGVVKDGNGPVALAFTGSGNQNLTGSSAYSGGTTLTRGTVTAGGNSALGTGTVTLNGGTLALSYPTGGGTLLPVITGFSSSTFTTNTNGAGSNGITGSTLQLTDTNATGGEATSAFTNAPVRVGSSFVASFQYTVTSPLAASGNTSYPADGFAFVLQNAGPTALGGNGGNFGYNGITPSAAVVTNLEPADSSGPGTAFASGGVPPTPAGFTDFDSDLNELEFTSTPVTLTVTLAYNASTQSLVETMQGPSGTATNTFSSINLSSLIGGSSAYVGFTGSDGSDYAGQSISNFTFSTLANGPTSLSNNVVALPSTSSVIQLAVSSSLQAGSVGSLTIGSHATVTVTASSLDGVTTHGSLTVNGLSLAGSSNAWTGKLDLTNNSLVVHGGSIAMVTNQVQQGYAGGTWQGSGGITSSTAAADPTHLTALGVILNDNGSGQPFYGASGALAATFGGASPMLDDVLVKYTYYGDTDLSGVVDGSDYSRIDNAYENNLTAGTDSQMTGWYNGDFNYDGVVDGSDYTLIDNAFNNQGVSLTASIAAQVGGGIGSAVPEPTMIGLITAGAIGLLGRRRRDMSVRQLAFGGPFA